MRQKLDQHEADDGNGGDEGFRALIVDTCRCTVEAAQQAGAKLAPALVDQAKHILHYALKMPSAWEVTETLLLTFAPHMERLGERGEWMGLLESAIEQAIAYQATANTQAELQLQLAILSYLVNDYEKACLLLDASVSNFATAKNRLGTARAYNELAWVAQLQQNNADAAHYVQAALQHLDESDSERAMSFRVLGMIANSEQRWAEALAYHQQAHELFQRAKDWRKVAWSLQNMALTLRNLEEYDQSIAYYQAAASRLLELGDLHRWVMTQIGLGTTYYYQGAIALAVPCFVAAEPLASRFHDNLFLAMIQNNLGLCRMEEQQFAQAQTHFQQAIARYQKIGNKAWELNAKDGKALAHLALAEFAQAKALLLEAIGELPLIVDQPNYSYLYQSLHKHLQDADDGESPANPSA